MLDDLLTYSRRRSAATASGATSIWTPVVDALSPGSLGAYAEPSCTRDREKLSRASWAIATMLLVVLRHLVVNAITFNTRPVPTVRHRGTWVEGRVAVVTVSDNGIGFEAAQKDRAFELFQRFNTREEYPGKRHRPRPVSTPDDAAARERSGVYRSPGGNGSIVTLTMPASPDLTRSQATSTNRRSRMNPS